MNTIEKHRMAFLEFQKKIKVDDKKLKEIEQKIVNETRMTDKEWNLRITI